MAQDAAVLARQHFRSGEGTLAALTSVSAATRHSIVKLQVDGLTVALGTVMDSRGLVLTKASEIRPGKLTCWLAGGREVEAEWVAADESEDVALVRVQAEGLRPMAWVSGEAKVGQWAITPGIETTPHAIGIVSAPARPIRAQRALLGFQFDLSTTQPKVGELLSGYGAEHAGLQPGDVILAVNEMAVAEREQVVEVLREFRAGQTVRVRIQRGADEFEREVRLSSVSTDPFGAGLSRGRSRRMGGEVSTRAEGFESVLQHDTVLPPWLCGGPLVNVDGKAIGLNIARAGRVATYALSPRVVQGLFESLRPAPARAVKVIK